MIRSEAFRQFDLQIDRPAGKYGASKQRAEHFVLLESQPAQTSFRIKKKQPEERGSLWLKNYRL
ncbi:MAG: hypothetical protein A3I29_00030 [Candidatus Magasanikbacteria bacterium RIFCSPLOWO2_02_FULL_44_11]|uniref:Uncharacterized protein n=1 Tax=Candidatus Magasanikbacteria bacterium RIFCSPLOWO2_02_FULL_44_11 TaxID=1798689 RepID=A0A1F6NC20_9BACT|nr:MAG: hypothetical protein A3I29_00030 [Candidatus Magasanikbacteria bacterium RIFCSPLOWO2_02_FULL_44_11]